MNSDEARTVQTFWLVDVLIGKEQPLAAGPGR